MASLTVILRTALWGWPLRSRMARPRLWRSRGGGGPGYAAPVAAPRLWRSLPVVVARCGPGGGPGYGGPGGGGGPGGPGGGQGYGPGPYGGPGGGPAMVALVLTAGPAAVPRRWRSRSLRRWAVARTSRASRSFWRREARSILNRSRFPPGGPRERPFCFSARLLRIGLLHPAYQKGRKEKPDQCDDKIEKKLHTHRRAGEPRDCDGDSHEEIEDGTGNEDHRTDQFSFDECS